MQLIRRSNTITVLLWVLVLRPLEALAWNIPGHMLSGAIAYQILQRENPTTVPIVRSILKKESLVSDPVESATEQTAKIRTRRNALHACRPLGG